MYIVGPIWLWCPVNSLIPEKRTSSHKNTPVAYKRCRTPQKITPRNYRTRPTDHDLDHDLVLDHDLDHLESNLPLWEVVQGGLYRTGPSQETYPRSCRLYTVPTRQHELDQKQIRKSICPERSRSSITWESMICPMCGLLLRIYNCNTYVAN